MPRVKRGVVARRRHKKFLNKPKAITVRVLASFVLLSKLLPKLLNMLIVTVVSVNVNLEHFGSPVLMWPRALMVLAIVD